MVWIDLGNSISRHKHTLSDNVQVVGKDNVKGRMQNIAGYVMCTCKHD